MRHSQALPRLPDWGGPGNETGGQDWERDWVGEGLGTRLGARGNEAVVVVPNSCGP